MAGGEAVSLAMVAGVSGVEVIDVDVFDRVRNPVTCRTRSMAEEELFFGNVKALEKVV